MYTEQTDFKNYKRMTRLARQELFLENWYYERFSPDFMMDFHCHPQIEMMYCENGSFDFVYIPDEETAQPCFVTVNKNCFIIVNTGYFHKLANLTPQTTIINLEFLSTEQATEKDEAKAAKTEGFFVSFEKLFACCPLLKDLIESDKNYYIFLDEKNISRTMKDIIKKATEPISTERSVYLSLLTNKLFLDVSHCMQTETHVKTGFVYVDEATIYINSHFLGKMGVSDIAKHVGVSEVYLQKLFKEKYGKTVYDVITENRIMQAKYLITQSNLSVNDIAKQCGFNSREQLIYNFRKVEKCSPSEFKKKNVGKNVRNFSNYGEFTLYENL